MYKVGFLLAFITTSFVYGLFLNRVPVHLNQDELGFSINAYSIAKTGMDENGRVMPIYFWHLGVMWATPAIVYLTAGVLKFFPLSEEFIRLPSVFVGLANLVLIWCLAKAYFKCEKWALAVVILLATTPVNFIHSRLLLDNLYPVPFVIAWLLCLLKYFEGKSRQFISVDEFL